MKKKALVLGLLVAASSSSAFAAGLPSGFPGINENLKLRGSGYGDGFFKQFTLLKLPQLATLAITLDNRGKGKLASTGVDLGLLTGIKQ